MFNINSTVFYDTHKKKILECFIFYENLRYNFKSIIIKQPFYGTFTKGCIPFKLLPLNHAMAIIDNKIIVAL